MAVKEFVPAKKSKKPQKRSVIGFIAFALFACLAIVGCVVNYSYAASNNAEAAKVSSECESVKEENDELEHFLEEKNHDEYYEKIAREQYGYAKPGEKVFYDSSYGK